MGARESTGVILAGGKATRLGGIAKGLVQRDGRPIVRGIADALERVTAERLLVADDPSPYGMLGWPVVPDGIAGAGPIGGLVAALERATTPFVLVVACDMPGVGVEVLELLRDRDERFDVVLPVIGGRPEPLCARWATRVAPVVRAEAEAGRRKMGALVDVLAAERIDETVLRSVDPKLHLTQNVNTPEDVERLGLTRQR